MKNRTEELKGVIKMRKQFLGKRIVDDILLEYEAELKGRLEAIDEFLREALSSCSERDDKVFDFRLKEIAKQLKGGKSQTNNEMYIL